MAATPHTGSPIAVPPAAIPTPLNMGITSLLSVTPAAPPGTPRSPPAASPAPRVLYGMTSRTFQRPRKVQCDSFSLARGKEDAGIHIEKSGQFADVAPVQPPR